MPLPFQAGFDHIRTVREKSLRTSAWKLAVATLTGLVVASFVTTKTFEAEINVAAPRKKSGQC